MDLINNKAKEIQFLIIMKTKAPIFPFGVTENAAFSKST